MKFNHLAKLVMSLEFVEDMTRNIQLHQAVADALSPFIVIESRVNAIDQVLEQVLFDPSGSIFPHVIEGDVIPKVTAYCHKSPSVSSIRFNPYSVVLVLPK